MKFSADAVILVFIVSSVLSIGVNLTVTQIVASLRFHLVAAAIVANFVIVPLAAVWIAKLVSLDEAQAAGLILLGAAAGAPFLPMLVETASGNVPASVALTVLLLLISPVYLPLVLPRIVPGVSVDAWQMAWSLLVSMLLPLATALAVKAYRESWAARLRPVFRNISHVSLAVAMVLVPLMHARGIADLDLSRAFPASLLFMGVSFGVGYTLGGRSRDLRPVLGFGTATRNYSVAILIGSQSFEDPNVERMILIMTFLALLTLIPAAIVGRQLRRRDT